MCGQRISSQRWVLVSSHDAYTSRCACIGRQQQPPCTPSSQASGQDTPSSSSIPTRVPARPEDVVRAYYRAVNVKDIDTAMQYIADDVVYEDFTYPEPLIGSAAVNKFLRDICELVPDNLDYIMDDVTSGDEQKVGVVWYEEEDTIVLIKHTLWRNNTVRHVELEGTPFPNARGCSFYRINDKGQICYARDIVESPIKPGDAALKSIGVIAPLVQRFGASPPAVPWASLGFWGFYAGTLELGM